MKDIIQLNSRYKIVNYLKKLPKSDGSESKTFVLKTDHPTLRVGRSDGKNQFIDPSGGPMISLGNRLEEADAVVKSIDYVEGYGYTITFE